MRPKVLLSWSSGKDSAWSLRAQGDVEVLPMASLARDMVRAGLRARLTCVDPCGERGEFHTFAYDGPMFARPLCIRGGEIVRRDGFAFADLELER